jgi:hypothetical protein
MPSFLGRAALALPVLLALAVPVRAEVGDEHLFLGNPIGQNTSSTPPFPE